MSETEKLIAEITTRFLLAHVEKSGLTNDPAYPNRALVYAKAIVDGAQKKGCTDDN